MRADAAQDKAEEEDEDDDDEEEEEEEEEPKAKKSKKEAASSSDNPNKGKSSCTTRSGKEAPKVCTRVPQLHLTRIHELGS